MGWRLLFSGTQSTLWLAAVLLAVTVTLVVSWWLLRFERQFVARRVGYTLLTLRLTVLAVLLLTMLQPVVTQAWKANRRERIVVGIDVSESMDTQDRHASTLEKLRWARSLGMLGNDQSDPLLNLWISDLSAGQQPQWLGDGRSAVSEHDHQLARSRQQQVQAVLEEFDEMSRREFAGRLLQAHHQSLLEELSQQMPVELRLFATHHLGVPGGELTRTLQASDESSQIRASLLPAGTDAVGFLSSLLSDEQGGELRSVILLSDGRQTASGDMVTEGRRLASLNVPVFTIPVGSARSPRDLSIISLEAPETIFVNDVARVTATLGTAGFEGQSLAVRLQQDGLTLQQQHMTPASDSAVVTFEIPSDQAGRFDYQILTDVQEGELRDDNNARDLSLQVVDNKAQVMLVDGDARWEFRYLKNLLDRDQQVQLAAILMRQPDLQLLNEPFIRTRLPEAAALEEQLARTDILILGDVPASRISDEAWQRIEAAVTADGLTLVILPGRRHMPHEFQSALLQALLPVTDVTLRLAEQFMATRFDDPQSVFRLQPTSDGLQLPMFQLADPQNADPRQPAGPLAFENLAGHPWMASGTPRPAATVWAQGVFPGDSAPPEAVVVHQHYGFGQVLWMGIDSTWRWRKRMGDSLHHRFWGQLIRWAARNKAAAGNELVRFSVSDVVIDETQSVQFTARWVESALPLLQDATVEAVVTPADESQASKKASMSTASTLPTAPAEQASATLPESDNQNAPPPLPPSSASMRTVVLQSVDGRPALYSGRLQGLPPGAWKVELQVRGGSVQFRERVTTDLIVQPQRSIELANVSCNRPFLQQLAELSGGQMIEPDQARSLISLMQPRNESDQQIQERRLWDHWGVMVLVFGLLMGEWVTRKLNGLP